MSRTRVTSPYYREATRRMNHIKPVDWVAMQTVWLKAEWYQQLSTPLQGHVLRLLLVMGAEGGSIRWSARRLRELGTTRQTLAPLLKLGVLVTFDPDDPPEWLRAGPGPARSGILSAHEPQALRNREQNAHESRALCSGIVSKTLTNSEHEEPLNTHILNGLRDIGAGTGTVDSRKGDFSVRDLLQGPRIRDKRGGYPFTNPKGTDRRMAVQTARDCIEARAEHGDIAYTPEDLLRGLDHRGFAPSVAQAAMEELRRND